MQSLNHKQKIIVVIVIIIMIIIIAFYIYKRVSSQDYFTIEQDLFDHSGEDINSKDFYEEEKVILHIVGSIKNPGIVKLKEGDRIIDAIEKAGGVLEDADISKVNLAYIVEDGQKIYIPSIHDTNIEDIGGNTLEYITKGNGENIIVGGNTSSSATTIININSANQSLLEQIPGVGPSTAQKIIEYREQNGMFYDIEDIKNVSGIGEAKFQTIKDYIKVK